MFNKTKSEDKQKLVDMYSKTMDATNKYFDKLNEKAATAPGNYVPYEIFRQSVELQTENLRQIYSMIHDLNMKHEVMINFRLGEMEVNVSGSEENKEFYCKEARELLNSLLSRAESYIPDLQKASKRDRDERDKAFC